MCIYVCVWFLCVLCVFPVVAYLSFLLFFRVAAAGGQACVRVGSKTKSEGRRVCYFALAVRSCVGKVCCVLFRFYPGFGSGTHAPIIARSCLVIIFSGCLGMEKKNQEIKEITSFPTFREGAPW